MNFMDRTSLGGTLAKKLPELQGKDAVIVCLQESSLLTCLTMASQLHAWVYPLIYVPVYSPEHSHVPIGAFDQDGEFCPLPRQATAVNDTVADNSVFVDEQRPKASKTIATMKQKYGLAFDPSKLDGRDVILAGDVVTSILPLVIAQRLLQQRSPKSLTAVVGNVTPEVAEIVRISAARTEILDVLSGVFSDEGHYFEHEDAYTDEQKYALAQHVNAYWQ